YSLNAQGVKDPLSKTGFTVDEFYTAREFPVTVSYTQPDIYNYQPKGWFSFFGGNIVHELVMSQGYAVQLNDMHGKPKAQRVYNQAGAEISSVTYYYNSERLGANTHRLSNKVRVIDEKGQITSNQ